MHVMTVAGWGAAGENHARGLLTSTCYYCLPGITEIALKALSTLNVRRAEKFPRFTNSVTYLQENLELLWNIDTYIETNNDYILAVKKYKQ